VNIVIIGFQTMRHCYYRILAPYNQIFASNTCIWTWSDVFAPGPFTPCPPYRIQERSLPGTNPRCAAKKKERTLAAVATANETSRPGRRRRCDLSPWMDSRRTSITPRRTSISRRRLSTRLPPTSTRLSPSMRLPTSSRVRALSPAFLRSGRASTSRLC
jgi:hypothetical protein